MQMTEEQRKAMYAVMRAANAYLDNVGESMKLNRERFEHEQRAREIMESVACAHQRPSDELIWENRRYDIAKRCAAMLSFGTVPDKFGERELSPAVVASTAIKIADELIKQLKGGEQ